MFDFPTTPAYGTNIQVPDGSWRAWDGVKWRAPLAGSPGGPFLPMNGGQLTGPLYFTATGGTALRSVQDRAADVANVLDFVQSGDNGDYALAINRATATGKRVWVPSGTWRLKSPVTLLNGVGMMGDGPDASILLVDGASTGLGSAAALVTVPSSNAAVTEISGLQFLFAQPADLKINTTAASGVGATTITMTSTTGLVVGNYVTDLTTGRTAIPDHTKITAINTGTNVVTLSNSIVSPSVGSGDQIAFGPSRTNYVPPTDPNYGHYGYGPAYPWAIQGAGRMHIDNVLVVGAWNGFNLSNAVCRCTNIEMGALNIGWWLDNALDFSHLRGWHAWAWGFPAPSAPYMTYEDGGPIGLQCGRCDGLLGVDVTLFRASIVTTANFANNEGPWIFEGLEIDSAQIISSYGNSATGLFINGYSLNCGYGLGTPVQVSAGLVQLNNGVVAVSGAYPWANLTGGALRISGSTVSPGSGAAVAVTQSAGALTVEKCYFPLSATQMTPFFNVTTGVVQFRYNSCHVGIGGTLLSITTDSGWSTVTSNALNGYSMSLPAATGNSTYDLTNVNGTYGQQLVLGMTGQSGRVDFRRGADGAQVAWVGIAGASGDSTTELNNGGGSPVVRLNAANAGGICSFLSNSVEVGRFDVNGCGISKVTAAAVAPGAGFAKLAFVAGTNAGTGKLVAYCGTSATPVTIMDNIGAGF